MTRRIAMTLWLGLSACLAESRADETLILNETTYSRQYIQFGVDRVSPAQLKAPETAALLGKKAGRGESALADLKNEVKGVWKVMGKKWDEAAEKGGWMDEAYLLYQQSQCGNNAPMMVLGVRNSPPDQWMAPEFDDSNWPRLQGSLVVGRPGGGSRDDIQELGRRAIFVRYRFEVPDPAKAGALTLKLVYRGGARVFLNGKEVSRGHLPEGEITPETRGADYPLEAYAPLGDDGALLTYDCRDSRAPAQAKGIPFFVSDLYGTFDKAVAVPPNEYGVPKEVWEKGMKYGRLRRDGRWCDRKNWDRLQGLRDRVLGPVILPANLLKKGSNVLAVEIRASDLHPATGGYSVWRWPFIYCNYWHGAWFHAQLLSLELQAKAGSVPTMRKRPPGMQVWVEDIHHRVVSSEFSDLGDATGTLRLVAPLNSEFSGQVVVGTDRELKGLKATASELKLSDGSGTIPASALSVLYMTGHPVTEIVYLSNSASAGRSPGHKCKPAEARDLLRKYGPVDLDVDALKPEEALREAEEIAFFDHIGAAAPTAVPAGTCQPVWVTLKTSLNAKPGTYRGSLKVEAEGMKPITVPVEAEIIGWRLPDTTDWQQVMQIEQSPYGVAEHYKVPLWSEEHFKLLEPSFRQLGRIGAKWLFVPVLQDTELGNRADSPLKWIRKKDGTLAFDYAVMDRYIDLALKYWGKPRVICFLVMHGGDPGSCATTVPLLDEAKGETIACDMSNKSPTYRQDWQAFGKALYGHIKAKGLLDAMYFGYRWDGDGDPGLSAVLGPVAPGVAWAAGGHGYGNPPHYKAASYIYNVNYKVASRGLGWKRDDVFLLNPRGGGTVLMVYGASAPALFRILPDRAVLAGCNGVARLAGDYWEGMYFLGCKAWSFLIPGMALNSWMLWPGPGGAESSQRFEVLREGTEEAEARIFIEQALDRKALPPELAKKADDVLFTYEKENYFIPMSSSDSFVPFFMGWQERSKRLFDLATEVAEASPFDLDRSSVKAELAAFGTAEASVKIRNWTTRAVDWKAETDAPWIELPRKSGSLEGCEKLNIVLNGAALLPESRVEGKVSITVGDKVFPVAVAAKVSSVLEYVSPDKYSVDPYIPDKGKVVFNVPAGESRQATFLVNNNSARELSWKCEGEIPAWVKLEPTSGKAAPQSGITVTVTAAPPDKESVFHEFALKVFEEGEANRTVPVTVPLVAYVIPRYQKPELPQGEAVVVTGDAAKALQPKAQYPWAAYRVPGEKEASTERREVRESLYNSLIRKKRYDYAVLGGVPQEAKFNLEGRAYRAFSVEVGLPDTYGMVRNNTPSPFPDRAVINFEIFVDGKLRTQSGIMNKTDEARLLVADNLEGAKELRLRVRFTDLVTGGIPAVWGDPKFYR